MRLPKPILGKLIVIYSYQQRYEMFLNIQNNTKKIPTFLWGSGRNTYVCQSKNTIQGWALLFFKFLYVIYSFNNLFCNLNTFINIRFVSDVVLFNVSLLQHLNWFELGHDHTL